MHYKRVEEKYVDASDGANARVLVIKSLTGTGKTQQALKEIEKYDTVVVVLSRVTLCYDFYKQTKQYGFELYNEQLGEIKSKKLIICINSFQRIGDVEFQLLIIDESESLLKHIHSDPYRLKYMYITLMNMIKKAKKTIMLDYGIGELSIHLLKDCQLQNQAFFINNVFKDQNKKAELLDIQQFFDTLTLYRNGKIFICCDIKKNADIISLYIQEELG